MEREKVTIPKEVAEAIKALRDWAWSDSELLDVREFLDVSNGTANGIYSMKYPISKWLSEDIGRMELYASAIINGYEVEQTPEEEVLEYYEVIAGAGDSVYYCGIRIGIRTTLDILGIKIEGINKEES